MTITPLPSRRIARRLLTVSVAGIALVATVASGSDEPAQRVDAPDGGSDAAAAENFAVGDHVRVGEWTVIAHGVTDPVTPANEFLAPSPGNRWVGVDVEVTNDDDEPRTVSSMMCFDLFDSTNRSYSVTITGDGSSSMDGTVAPGAGLRGDVEFEIPEDATGLALEFDCDLMSGNTATIDLS